MSPLRFGVFAAAACAIVVAGSPAAAQDQAHGAAQYQLCAACHGDAGAGIESRGAPAIAGLPVWYVDAQLKKFRAGQRGYARGDDTGLQMRPMASALVDEQAMLDVVAYVRTLAPGSTR
jgi:cytochrome c553